MMLSHSISFPPCRFLCHKWKQIPFIRPHTYLSINHRFSPCRINSQDLPARGDTIMPKHVAVIMDGNVRWAKENNLPPQNGHQAMFVALTKLYQQCCRLGIRVLTVFAFSIENWNRDQTEVEFIMDFMESYIHAQLENFIKHGVQICFIGDLTKLSSSLQSAIGSVEEKTKNNKKLQLIIAMSYSGKNDLVQAYQSIAEDVKNGVIQPQDIDESLIQHRLLTNCTEFPNPDILIRTGGELRVSNFLLWQLAYTELFFHKSFWPDFGETSLLQILDSFHKRQRRYGKRDPIHIKD